MCLVNPHIPNFSSTAENKRIIFVIPVGNLSVKKSRDVLRKYMKLYKEDISISKKCILPNKRSR